MQQRQPRLGDILDDYCPRERRLTNHAVVAMIGDEVKQTRCTTCETEHAYKHAKVPRQRRKSDTPAALYAPGSAGGPKRVRHEPDVVDGSEIQDAQERDEVAAPQDGEPAITETQAMVEASTAAPASEDDPVENAENVENVENVDNVENDKIDESDESHESHDAEEGPVHRPLIRATLPRPEGQPPPTRPAPDFTIRQPGGRQNRFRPRNRRGGGQQFFGNRSNGNMGGGGGGGNSVRGGMPRQGGGRPGEGSMSPRGPRRHSPGPGRKRSK